MTLPDLSIDFEKVPYNTSRGRRDINNFSLV